MANLGNYDIVKLKDLISQLENDVAPLTKTKAKKQSDQEPDKQETETIKNVIQEKTERAIQEKVIKPKQTRTWTAGRAEAVKKMQESRKKQVEDIRNKKKLDVAKTLLSQLEIKQQEQKVPAPEPQLEMGREPDDISSSSSDEEIVVVKKRTSKAKPVIASDKKVIASDKKKKTKTIVIQSESESDDDDEVEIEEVKPKQRAFKSARNKKSVIKVHGEHFNPDNFFV